MEKRYPKEMNVPAVGRLTAADLMRLKVLMLVYLDEPEIQYAKELVKKLDETVQAILIGELEVSPDAVAHLPRKANR